MGTHWLNAEDLIWKVIKAASKVSGLAKIQCLIKSTISDPRCDPLSQFETTGRLEMNLSFSSFCWDKLLNPHAARYNSQCIILSMAIQLTASHYSFVPAVLIGWTSLNTTLSMIQNAFKINHNENSSDHPPLICTDHYFNSNKFPNDCVEHERC